MLASGAHFARAAYAARGRAKARTPQTRVRLCGHILSRISWRTANLPVSCTLAIARRAYIHVPSPRTSLLLSIPPSTTTWLGFATLPVPRPRIPKPLGMTHTPFIYDDPGGGLFRQMKVITLQVGVRSKQEAPRVVTTLHSAGIGGGGTGGQTPSGTTS